jgi:hypothetical protein
VVCRTWEAAISIAEDGVFGALRYPGAFAMVHERRLGSSHYIDLR